MTLKKNIVSFFVVLFALLPFGAWKSGKSLADEFTNPIVRGNFPDPYVMEHEGFYYWCRAEGGRRIIVEKLDGPLPHVDRTLETQEVYLAGEPPVVAHLWAPQIYAINGKWYIYASAEMERKRGFHNLRMFVLESDHWNGPYAFKASLKTRDWAIDPDLFIHPETGQMYLSWSQFKLLEEPDLREQQIWIGPMSDPWTLDETRSVMLSRPEHDWEKKLGLVNEGPQFLLKNDTLHIVYSASQCHGRYYCLGLLSMSLDDDHLDPRSWRKSQTPVFQEGNGVYGPGHNCFIKSPDGKDWILYHAHATPWETAEDHGGRSTYAQPFTWAGNTPVFGKPRIVVTRKK